MTIRQNLDRLLARLGMDGMIVFTRDGPDRCFGWPRFYSSEACRKCPVLHVVLNGWNPELRESAEYFHGTESSFREPGGVTPALQVSFHKTAPGHKVPYFVEMDIDLAAPDWRHPVRLLQHAAEVSWNAATGQKTDQERVAKLLDQRFREAGG